MPVHAAAGFIEFVLSIQETALSNIKINVQQTAAAAAAVERIHTVVRLFLFYSLTRKLYGDEITTPVYTHSAPLSDEITSVVNTQSSLPLHVYRFLNCFSTDIVCVVLVVVTAHNHRRAHIVLHLSLFPNNA